jgi:hypothetical protein
MVGSHRRAADSSSSSALVDISAAIATLSPAAIAVMNSSATAWAERERSTLPEYGPNHCSADVLQPPGGVGVNQATNVAALRDVTDATTATAYSLGQQLAITAWNVVLALVLVIWAFGWTGGKLLVGQSYTDAKVKVEEQKTRRAETKAAKRAARRSRH